MKPRQLALERHKVVMWALNGMEAVSVTVLARLTGVSVVTIRRDLAELTHESLVTRVHSGALHSPKRGTAHPFPLRKTQDFEAKYLLTKATVRLIDDGESVILDSGTTCNLVVENLVGRDITVLALNLRVAITSAEAPGMCVAILDDVVETASFAMLASPVIGVVRNFRADVAVLGACAASVANGLTCINPSDATLRRNILQSVVRAILPATPRKPTRSSVHGFDTLEDLADLLTTSDISRESSVNPHSNGVLITICGQYDPKVPGPKSQITGSQPRTTELGAPETGRKELRSGRTRKDPNDCRASRTRAQGLRLPRLCTLAKTVRSGKRQVRVQ